MTETRALQKGLALATPALLFGFLLAAQWATLAQPAAQDVGLRYVDPLAKTATRLQDEQAGLKRELAAAREELDALQRAASAQNATLRGLQSGIDELRAAAGLTAVSGEGVVVTLDLARASEQGREACLATDLTDIVGAAWRGGAAAVAIDSERMVASSSVYCVGATIVVNGSIVSAPYTIAIVGPAAAITAVLDDPAELRDLKRRRDQGAVAFTKVRSPSVGVPAYAGTIPTRIAVPR